MVVSGASRKNEKWEHTEGETVAVEGHSEAEKLASDPMYRLEHNVEDKQKADDAAPRIARIVVSGVLAASKHSKLSAGVGCTPRPCSRRKRMTSL